MTAETGSTQVSRIIKAPRERIYQAFLDPEAIASWYAPDGMRGYVHSFEPYEGGAFRISLRYLNEEDAQAGKSGGDTDTYHGRFTRLVPNELIVQAIEFETDDPSMAGEMIMQISFADVAGGTEVSLHHAQLPAGIRPEDNEIGSQQSLQKLAEFVE